MRKNLEDLMVVNFPLIEAAKKSFLASTRACFAVENNAPSLQNALTTKQTKPRKHPR